MSISEPDRSQKQAYMDQLAGDFSVDAKEAWEHLPEVVICTEENTYNE